MFRILININTTVIPPNHIGEGYISGVGRSTQCLLNALSQIKIPNVKIETCLEGLAYYNVMPSGVFPNHKIILPYKLIPLYRKMLNYDLYHYPNNYYARTYHDEKYVLTIHDVIQYKRAVREGRRKEINYITKNVRNASSIVTCSLYSRNQILEAFNCSPTKIVVIPWGVDTKKFCRLDSNIVDRILKKIDIKGKYFLSVSCKDERKNIPNLLEAYSIYAQKGKYPLLLLWDNPPKNILNKYAKEINEKKIKFLSYVDDDSLVALYNNAQCTFFPSREEGFGFPILESFACGTPVMTCRNSSLYEVGGDLAHYVEEDDIIGMSEMMSKMESIDKRNNDVCYQNYVQQFSWENTAQKYVDYYLNFTK